MAIFLLDILAFVVFSVAHLSLTMKVNQDYFHWVGGVDKLLQPHLNIT